LVKIDFVVERHHPQLLYAKHVTLPTPRLIDAAALAPLRWGVLGAGWIADVWANTVRTNSNQEIRAVASLTPGRADAFARHFAIPHAYDSYEALLARTDIDAVYVANLPHDHFATTMMVLDSGRPVLLEKPVTKDLAQAATLFATGRQRGLLVMEAMWSRYLPQMDVVRQLLADGALGEPQLVLADFCQDNRHVDRLWRRGAGSPLWDMGIYPIALCQMVFGEPTEVEAWGELNDDRMDLESTIHLRYANGGRATCTTSGIIDLANHTSIAGTEASIEFEPPYIFPTTLRVAPKGFNQPAEIWRDEYPVRGHAALVYQVYAFVDYLTRGLLESPLQSHEDSLACLRVAQRATDLIGALV
jgi:predicted dehydrogenase